MNSEWKLITVNDFAEVVGGGTPSTNDPSNFHGDIAWITPKDLASHNYRYISRGERNISEKGLRTSAAKLMPKGTVLLTSRAPIGYLAIAENTLTTNQGFKSLIPHEGFDSEFIYYLLKANVDYLKSQGSGTTFGELSGETLKKIIFQVPPLLEQRAIAEVLSSLDDKIELNRRMNVTLEELAQAIFINRFINNPDREKWKIGSIKDDFELTMGQSPPGSTYNEECIGVPFFQGCSDFGFRFPKKRVFCNEPTRFAEAGDTLVSVRAPVGEMNIAFEDCAIGRGLAAIRHKSGSRSYSFYSMKNVKNDFNNFESEGTVFGSINKDSFLSLKVIIPDRELIDEFETFCYPFDQLIVNNEKEIRILSELRDTLLPKLISGQVRIKKNK